MDIDSEYPATARDQAERRNEIQGTMRIAAIIFAGLLVLVFVVSYRCFRMKRARRLEASRYSSAPTSPAASAKSPGAQAASEHGSAAEAKDDGGQEQDEKVQISAPSDTEQIQFASPQDTAERKVDDLSDEEGDKAEVKI
jgi:hypothetical protein